MKTQYFAEGLSVMGDFGKQFFQDNKAHIFTALSMAGTVATGIISAKDGAKAARKIDQQAFIIGRELTTSEKVKLCWKDFIDAAVIGAGSCAATFASDAINTRTIADRTALLVASERAYEQLSKKTQEVLGKDKQKEIKDEIIKEKITAHPEMISQSNFANAPRVGNGALYPFLDEYSELPFWSNLDYIDKWIAKLNAMMRDLKARDRNNNYCGQKIGVPYSEWVSVMGYDRKICATPERRNAGWNKGYDKDGDDDDPIEYVRYTKEYEPGFAVTVLSWVKDPTDMSLGALIKSSGF